MLDTCQHVGKSVTLYKYMLCTGLNGATSTSRYAHAGTFEDVTKSDEEYTIPAVR